MRLYHGTSAANVAKILKEGIKPRGKKKGNWEEHPSAPDRVYLTKAYAVYFACAATENGGKGAVIAVDVDPAKLVADEDSLAQVDWADIPEMAGMSLAEKTRYWKKNAHLYPAMAEWSLDNLGNAAHMGKIEPEEIEAVVEFDIDKAWAVSDPTISIMNYKLLGGGYEASLEEFVESNGETLLSPYGDTAVNMGTGNIVHV